MNITQVASYISYMLYSWRRSITGWMTQQFPLYVWSILIGAYDVYATSVQHLGPVFLFGVTWVLGLVAPEYMPLISMIIISLSIIIMRPKMIHVGLFMRIQDMYITCKSALSRLVGLEDNTSDAHLRGHPLQAHVAMMILQIVIWLGIYFPWAPHGNPYVYLFSWHNFALMLPIIPFTCFFMCDGGYTIRGMTYAPLRALRLLWYNLPICIIVGFVALGWSWLMSRVAYLYIIDLASIPLWLSVWYTIYIKSIYEQFSRYYGDAYACGSDTT